MKRGVAEQCAPLIGRREGVCEEPEDKSAPGRQSQACSQIAQRHTKRRRAGREQSCVVQSTTRGAWVAVLVGVTGCGTLLREASAGVFFQDEHNIKRIGIQGWVVPRVTFFHRKHFCRSNSSQACSPAPVDGIRAQDHPFSCTSASVPFRGPEIDPRCSVRGRSEMTEIVTRSSGDSGEQDVTS